MFEKIAQALTRFGRDETPFKLYLREVLPCALQGPIFNADLVPNVYDKLADSGMNWIFESTRTGQPAGNVDEAPPEHRDRRTLDECSAEILRADLMERDIHGFRRFVALYGGDEELLTLTEDEALYDAVEAFAEGRHSPLKTLIIQFGDVVPDVIYYVSSIPLSIQSLISALDIPSSGTMPHLKYRELKDEDLETAIKYLSCAEHDH